MNIAYFQQVISSVLSSTLIFQRKSSLWKMYLAKSGKSWKKYFPFFLAFLLSISYFFYLYLWLICLCRTCLLVHSERDWIFILTTWRCTFLFCFSSRAQYSSNYLMNLAIPNQWRKFNLFYFLKRKKVILQ